MLATRRNRILSLPMRKLLFLAAALVVLAAPAVAVAVAQSADDGTLVVRDADGKVRITAVGGFLGRLDQGRVTIVDPVDEDSTGPVVTGCDFAPRIRDLDTGGTATTCIGTRVRFRLVGGRFKVVISGTGIDLSAVGKGMVVLAGAGGSADGKYSLNDQEFRSMPDLPLTLLLKASQAAP